MTIQEAYNKGLTDAETAVIDKLMKALDKVDDSPFANPEMEALRQAILTRPPDVVEVEVPVEVPIRVEVGPPVIINQDDKEIFDVLELMIRGTPYHYSGTKEKELIINFYGELMSFLRSKLRLKNKLAVRMKSMIRKIDFELTFERTKVN